MREYKSIMSKFFNQDSLQKIVNIVQNVRNQTTLTSKYIAKAQLYRDGVYLMIVYKNEMSVNSFYFLAGDKGEINNIAIYGLSLEGHLRAIQSSMTIFGLPVESAFMDFGREQYVDVYLNEY